MKLLPPQGELLIFAMNQQEREILLALLENYPAIPVNYPGFMSRNENGKKAPDADLLAEVMEEQRKTNKKTLQEFLAEADRWKQEKKTWLFQLKQTQLEWLLQIINEIRVGMWIRLGSPDPKKMDAPPLNEDTTPYYLKMELCGRFQMVFLSALENL